MSRLAVIAAFVLVVTLGLSAGLAPGVTRAEPAGSVATPSRTVCQPTAIHDPDATPAAGTAAPIAASGVPKGLRSVTVAADERPALVVTGYLYYPEPAVPVSATGAEGRSKVLWVFSKPMASVTIDVRPMDGSLGGTSSVLGATLDDPAAYPSRLNPTAPECWAVTLITVDSRGDTATFHLTFVAAVSDQAQ